MLQSDVLAVYNIFVIMRSIQFWQALNLSVSSKALLQSLMPQIASDFSL